MEDQAWGYFWLGEVFFAGTQKTGTEGGGVGREGEYWSAAFQNSDKGARIYRA